jgi:hypothetical protein
MRTPDQAPRRSGNPKVMWLRHAGTTQSLVRPTNSVASQSFDAQLRETLSP